MLLLLRDGGDKLISLTSFSFIKTFQSFRSSWLCWTKPFTSESARQASRGTVAVLGLPPVLFAFRVSQSQLRGVLGQPRWFSSLCFQMENMHSFPINRAYWVRLLIAVLWSFTSHTFVFEELVWRIPHSFLSSETEESKKVMGAALCMK